MEFNPIALTGTIVGGLVLAGLLGWIRRPRLVVLVPRSFTYSQITDRGQLVEISVFNRSFKTEETVEVTLNRALRYELLGSNAQDAVVEGNKIKMPRIAPSDDVTVLLLIEHGSFKRDDIVQCLSKETKGTVVGKLEEVPPSGPQRVAIISLCVAVPALLYGLTFVLDYAYSTVKHPAPVSAAADERAPIDIRGWKVPWFHEKTTSLLAPFKDGRIGATYGTVTRKGDLATVPITISNQTDQVLKARIAMVTAASSKRFKSYELATGEFLLTPGTSQSRSVTVVVPQNGTSTADRTVYVDVDVHNTDGQNLSFKGQLEIN